MSKSFTAGNQILMVPITLIFFILMGVIISDELNLNGSWRSGVILISVFIGITAAGIEFYMAIKKIQKDHSNSVTEEQNFAEKQRKMILEAFGDDLESMNND